MANEPIYLTIGASVKALRKERGLTQEQLAARLSISRASLANVERGHQKILVHQLLAIARALEATLNDLLPYEASELAPLPLPANLNALQQKQIARLLSGPIKANKGSH